MGPGNRNLDFMAPAESGNLPRPLQAMSDKAEALWELARQQALD